MPRRVPGVISEPILEELLGRRPSSIERLGGGTRKGVYRLTMPDGGTRIAYSWAKTENYWPQRDGDGAHDDPFTAGVGFDLFRAAHLRLASLACASRRSTPSVTTWLSWRTSPAGAWRIFSRGTRGLRRRCWTGWPSRWR